MSCQAYTGNYLGLSGKSAASTHRSGLIRIEAGPVGPARRAWAGPEVHPFSSASRRGALMSRSWVGSILAVSSLAGSFAPGASAHPASGIVVNAKGEVYFFQTGRGV